MSKYEYIDRNGYEDKYEKITRKSVQNDPDLTAMERETSIIMTDDEDIAHISSSQKPVMKYLLLSNKNFIIDGKGLAVKNGKIVGVNGEISKNCIRFSKNPRKYFGRFW